MIRGLSAIEHTVLKSQKCRQRAFIYKFLRNYNSASDHKMLSSDLLLIPTLIIFAAEIINRVMMDNKISPFGEFFVLFVQRIRLSPRSWIRQFDIDMMNDV